MTTLNLPSDLSNENLEQLYLYHYYSKKECIKQQINLTQNVFSFLIDGQKEVFTNNNSLVLENSNFLLMKSGHCLMTEKLSNANNDYQSMLFFFSNENILQFIQKFDIKLCQNTIPQSAYAFQYDKFVKNYVDSLIDISKFKSNLQKKMIQIKFEEIMIYLLENNGTDFINSMINQHDRSIQNFLNIIEHNKLKKMSLNELAFLSNMSLSRFKREFEKHFHESPSKWFTNKRLEHSAFILKNSLKRPSDIYEEVGYENLSNFINAFKAKFGVTPKQYQLD